MLPSSNIPLPDQDFKGDWQDHIPKPFVSSHILEKLDQALAACIQVSAIITCRNLDSLHPDEDRALSDAVEIVIQNHEFISKAAERSGADEILWASDYLGKYWNNVVEEFEAAQDGKKIENPICNSSHQALIGSVDDRVIEMAGTRILILQAECFKEAG
jgi:hypothetical protein